MGIKWAEKEMEGLDLGDKRLEKRAKMVLSTLAERPSQPFPQQFTSSAELKACYRLFNSDLVSSESILQPHYERTIERSKKYNLVIVASDSSSANYTTRSSHPDTGYISSNNAQGFLMHVSMATTIDRQPLGIIHSKFWSREKKKPAFKTHRDYLPIEQKESYKWIESYRETQTFADKVPETQVVFVADREADILELWKEAEFNKSKNNPAHVLVRCNHNRCVGSHKLKPRARLLDFMASTSSVGESQFELRDRKTNKVKRVVKQEIKASKVLISPAKRAGKEVSDFEINVVSLKEIGAPVGEKPVEWCLLTTLPIDDQDDIRKVIRSYLARWDIEVLFRTFKSGCKVESRSLRSAKRIYPMFAFFLIISWRINNLVQLAKTQPDLPCTTLFSDSEWQAAVAATTKSLASRKTPPTIHEMLEMVAKLGGYLNRKKDPRPGATVLWRGLEYLRGFEDAFNLFKSQEISGAQKDTSSTYG